MTYQIVVMPSAKRALSKLERKIGERIAQAIEKLADDPRPKGCVKLTGIEGWRIRVGDWRVVYDIDDNRVIVFIIRIADRKEVYK